MTATQREDQAIADQAKTAMVAFSSCHERVGAKPEYVDFATAFPIGAGVSEILCKRGFGSLIALSAS